MRSLAVWETHSTKILEEMMQEYMARMKAIRKRGEAATDISEVYSVSRELREISEKEIPEFIWSKIFHE